MAKRILIADDSMRWRMELRDLLLSFGFSVVGEASNGRQAVELYERTRPDLVIVDVRMPDMDGVAAIREIRLRDPDALALICGGSGEKAALVEGLYAGAADFISKPYAPQRVVRVVSRVLAGIRGA